MLWVLITHYKSRLQLPAAAFSFHMTYYELLRHPFWQKKSAQIKDRDEWQCRRCTDAFSNLQVHHLYYKFGTMPWEYPDDSMITLCDLCHNKAEFTKWMLTKGQSALIRLGIVGADCKEVIEFIIEKANRYYAKDITIQYITDIKNQLNG